MRRRLISDAVSFLKIEVMMDKVKKMYSLMIERYESSPYTKFQAEVYRKILALANECDSVATMTVRLQNEGYNAMPAEALIKDKLSAHYQAAIDNGLEEQANIYKNALENIIANPQDAYLTGFYDDIKKANLRYSKTLERLLASFNDFVHYKIEENTPTNAELRYNDWKEENKQLSEIVNQKPYRKHFACSDEFLKLFANEYETSFFNKEESDSTQTNEEFEQAWNDIKNRDADRFAMAQSELPKYRGAAIMCIAPNTKDGDYEYINEEFENN